jgi:hypothetical protein
MTPQIVPLYSFGRSPPLNTPVTIPTNYSRAIQPVQTHTTYTYIASFGRIWELRHSFTANDATSLETGLHQVEPLDPASRRFANQSAFIRTSVSDRPCV